MPATVFTLTKGFTRVVFTATIGFMRGGLTKCIKLTTTLNQSCVKSSVSLCAGKMSSINVRDKNRSPAQN